MREPDSILRIEGIFKTVWELRKQGYSKATIDGYDRKLKTLSRIADLQDPENVKSVIALKDCSVAFKEALCKAYDHYVRVNGLVWVKPFYKRQRGLPYVAKSEQVAKIVARASRKYALIFSLLAETGLRPIEAEGLTLRNVDLKTGVLSVKSAKNGNPKFQVKSCDFSHAECLCSKKTFSTE
jgi:integrase